MWIRHGSSCVPSFPGCTFPILPFIMRSTWRSLSLRNLEETVFTALYNHVHLEKHVCARAVSHTLASGISWRDRFPGVEERRRFYSWRHWQRTRTVTEIYTSRINHNLIMSAGQRLNHIQNKAHIYTLYRHTYSIYIEHIYMYYKCMHLIYEQHFS